MKVKHPYKEAVVKNNYKVINCKNCGYWHVHPIPKEKDLINFYETKYYETLGDNRTMTDKRNDPDGFYTIQYEDRLRYLTRFLPTSLNKTVLDIGTGYGDFLRFMKKRGWKTQGLEPSKLAWDSIKDRKALNIKQGNIKELANLNFRQSSVVTLNNVLEHLRNPKRVLEVIRKALLVPKGILSIVVPNDFNILQRMLMNTIFKSGLKNRYYWLYPPAHLNYWSIEMVRKFLLKSGFKVLYLTVDFPMEFFLLMGDNYITHPKKGRLAHLKRVQFEKYIREAKMLKLKDELFESFARIGIGRSIHVICTMAKAKKEK